MSQGLRRIVVDLMPLLPGGDNGGAKIFILELLRQLARMAPNTQFILLVSVETYPEIQTLEQKNVRCLLMSTLSPSMRRGGRYIARLPLPTWVGKILYRFYGRLKKRHARKDLVQLKPDLVFCPFTALTYDFTQTTPIVCVVYDLQHRTYPQFFSKAAWLHREAVFQKACERATAIAAISEYSRQAIVKDSSYDPLKVKTIYLQMGDRLEGLQTGSAEETLFSALAERYQLQAHAYLFYPANYWEHKNHDKLIRAFAMAQEALPRNMHLVFTGAGSEREALLKALVEERGLNDRIIFLGYLSNRELAVLLRHAAAMIFPSLYEGFGLPVIEAMTSGIPVGCSNVTALPEIVDKAALLFNPDNIEEIASVIVTLIGDLSMRARLIALGKRRACHFSDATQMAEEYWKLFETIFVKSKGSTV